MGLMEPKTTPSSASNSEKLSPTSSQPDKEKDKSKTLPDCQILTTSDILDTSEGEISAGDSSEDSNRCRTKKKKGKRKLKSGMMVKVNNAGIKVRVKWAQLMLGTKKEVNFDNTDFNQFVFGESRLINRSKIDLKEKETRIHLMPRI